MARPSGEEITGVAAAVAVPGYLKRIYWWAYIHPLAVRLFEREWLIDLILLGNYSRLRDAALLELGSPARGRTLQVGCAYGDLTLRLSHSIPNDGALDVVDVLPIQLRNLHGKLPAGSAVNLLQRDSASLGDRAANYDRVLVFFLLHEQPEDVRRRTVSEVLRVVKPGGKIILIDYHRPNRWHPLRWMVRAILGCLEPYALDLWHQELAQYLPDGAQISSHSKQTYFGGLYQKVVVIR